MSEEVGLVSVPEAKIVEQFKKVLTKVDKPSVAIFSHRSVDPDAIGSMMGVEFLLQKYYNANTCCFYDGTLSHPQTVSFVELLHPYLHKVECFEPDKYDFCILVDTVPKHAGTGSHKVDFSICIDHHKDMNPNGGFKGIYINLDAGSCCGIVYEIIKQHKLKFKTDGNGDSCVATALMAGILSDTENLSSDDTQVLDFDAYRELFDYRNSDALKKIIRYKRPLNWVKVKWQGCRDCKIKDGIAVVGLGMLDAQYRAVIADMGDDVKSWDSIETVVVFALFDDERIEGSVRSNNPSVSVSALCEKLGGKFGSGGGKLGKGAYSYPLGAMAFDPEEDENIKQKMWNVINERETERIFRVISH